MASIWDEVLALGNQTKIKDPILNETLALSQQEPSAPARNPIYDEVLNVGGPQPQAFDRVAPTAAPIPSIYDEVMSNAAGGGRPVEPSEKGIGGHILDILGALDKPRNAVATAIKHAGTDVGFLGGASRGWNQTEETSYGDLLGIPATRDDDSWGAYLAKGGSRFLLDAIGDPLNLVAALGLGAKAGSLSAKAARGVGLGSTVDKIQGIAQKGNEALAGTTFGRMLISRAPDEKFELMKQRMARESGEVYQELSRQIENINRILDEQNIPRTTSAMRELGEKLERPLHAGEDLDAEIRDAFQGLRDLSLSKLGEYNQWAGRLGYPVKEAIDADEFYDWLPRVLTGKARIEDAPWWPGAEKAGQIPTAVALEGTPEQSRTLQRWVLRDALEDTGDLLNPGARPLITKMDDESLRRGGLKDIPGQGLSVKTADGWKPVTAVQASTEDLRLAGIDKFVADPAAALGMNISKKQARIQFMKMVDESMNEGAGWVKPLAYDNGQEVIEKGYRKTTVPGMENHQVKKWVGNQLENMHNIMMDPKSATGTIESFLKAFNDSKLGQYLNMSSTHWKRNQLPLFPGWHAGNAVSNQVLAYLAGVRDPRYIKWAADVQLGRGDSLIRGFDNIQLRDGFRSRGILGTGWSADEGATGVLGSVSQSPTKARVTEMMGESLMGKGVPESVANLPAGIAKRWEWLNDKGFQAGMHLEDNTKAAVALNYLKKAQKAGRTIDDSVLDEAALHAKNYLFDYGQLTPFEKQLKSFMPFYSWFRNIIGRTAKDVVTAPNDLARIGRLADATMNPLSQEDQNLAPPFMLSPAYGPAWYAKALGFAPGENITEVGRFIPQGTVSEFMNRPGKYAVAQGAPWLRAILEGITGRSYHDDRVIDDQAGGLASGFYNALTGGDYELGSKKFFGQDIPRSLDYSLRSYSPVGRYLNTMNTTLADAAWDEPANQVKMGPLAKANWVATGGKAYPFEREKYQSMKLKDWQKELTKTKADIRTAAMREDTDRIQHYVDIYKNRINRNPLNRVPEAP